MTPSNSRQDSGHLEPGVRGVQPAWPLQIAGFRDFHCHTLRPRSTECPAGEGADGGGRHDCTSSSSCSSGSFALLSTRQSLTKNTHYHTHARPADDSAQAVQRLKRGELTVRSAAISTDDHKSTCWSVWKQQGLNFRSALSHPQANTQKSQKHAKNKRRV